MKTKLKKKIRKSFKVKIPNALTRKTIEDAHNGIGIKGYINDIKQFMESL